MMKATMWLSLPTSAAVAWEIFTCFFACARAWGVTASARTAARPTASVRSMLFEFIDIPPVVAKNTPGSCPVFSTLSRMRRDGRRSPPHRRGGQQLFVGRRKIACGPGEEIAHRLLGGIGRPRPDRAGDSKMLGERVLVTRARIARQPERGEERRADGRGEADQQPVAGRGRDELVEGKVVRAAGFDVVGQCGGH